MTRYTDHVAGNYTADIREGREKRELTVLYIAPRRRHVAQGFGAAVS